MQILYPDQSPTETWHSNMISKTSKHLSVMLAHMEGSAIVTCTWIKGHNDNGEKKPPKKRDPEMQLTRSSRSKQLMPGLGMSKYIV